MKFEAAARWARIVAVSLVVVCIGGWVVSLAGDCAAEIDSDLRREEETGNGDTRYVFGVEVSSQESCAVVHFDLITVEAEPNSEPQTKTVSKQAKVHDGSLTMKVNHIVSSDSSLISWEFKLTACNKC